MKETLTVTLAWILSMFSRTEVTIKTKVYRQICLYQIMEENAGTSNYLPAS